MLKRVALEAFKACALLNDVLESVHSALPWQGDRLAHIAFTVQGWTYWTLQLIPLAAYAVGRETNFRTPPTPWGGV